MIRRQVSRVCPNCRATISKRARPRKWFILTHEYFCLACGTRYSKPTPVELAVTAVFLSIPVLFFGVGSTVAAAHELSDFDWRPFTLLVLVVIAGFCLWLGASALIEGVRGFLEVRAELMPQGFPVLPKAPDPAAFKCSTNLDTSSVDVPRVNPIKAAERRP